MTKPLPRLTIWLVLAVTLIGVLAGCGHQPPPSPQSARPGDTGIVVPSAGPLANGTPDDSATEALTLIWSWQPATDADSAAGFTRARPWLTGDLAAVAARAGQDSGVQSGITWKSWHDEKAIVTAGVKVAAQDDAPGAQIVARTATVVQTVLHANGATEDLTPMSFQVEVRRDPDGRWRMSRMDIPDTPGGS